MNTLNADHIEAVALEAALLLRLKGFARVELQPGDMTRYDILVVAPEGFSDPSGVELLVGLVNQNRLMPWFAPTYMTENYAETLFGSEATGRVMAAFLNALGPWIAATEKKQ